MSAIASFRREAPSVLTAKLKQYAVRIPPPCHSSSHRRLFWVGLQNRSHSEPRRLKAACRTSSPCSACQCCSPYSTTRAAASAAAAAATAAAAGRSYLLLAATEAGLSVVGAADGACPLCPGLLRSASAVGLAAAADIPDVSGAATADIPVLPAADGFPGRCYAVSTGAALTGGD